MNYLFASGAFMYSRKKTSGFTLIELMITVAIIAILAGVALPSYQNYVKRGNRAAAQAQMMEIANREQQIFLANRAYADKTTLEGTGYGLPGEVSSRYTYTITLDQALNSSCTAVASSVPAFVITFTPTGSQASDGTLTLSSDGIKCPADKW